MQIFYKSDVAKHPCIFGITASPIFGRDPTEKWEYTGPEGVEKLCSDLSVEHTDARVLMLEWVEDEWRTGLTSLHADTLKKLKKQLSDLWKEVHHFNFCIGFLYISENKQKNLDIETACVLLDLVLGPNFNLQVDSFIKYLK
ncbi:hypothetical protein R6Q57_024904, partial [Mikania cordata]